MTSIAIIGSKGIPAKYGGFETLAEHLVKQLAHKLHVTVYCSGPAYDHQPPTYLGAKLVYVPLRANGAQSIPYDVMSMVSAQLHADVVLILGVSGCAFLPLVKLFSKKTFIVHLDGVDWRRPKWGWAARNFLKFSEWVAAKTADCLIADNSAIQNYIFETYRQDSFLIEYGGDHSVCDESTLDSSSESAKTLHKELGDLGIDGIETGFSSYAFSVCRIEPENNIHAILAAFAKNKELPLIFVGNWSFSEYGKSLRAEYGNLPNIFLLDPIYDPVKLFPVRSNAALYIHGHSAGGTNPSLVEAMYLGLPIVAFDVEFNRATTDNKAQYFSDTDSLVSILANLNIDELAKLARRMKNVAQFRYTWPLIADKYFYLFNATGSGSPKKLDISTVIANMPGHIYDKAIASQEPCGSSKFVAQEKSANSRLQQASAE